MSWKTPIRLLLLLSAAALLQAEPAAAQHAPSRAPRATAIAGTEQRTPLVMEKSGTLQTRPGLRLHLRTDVGHVRVRTHDAPQVAYRLRLETNRSQPDAEQLLSRFQVIARSAPDGAHITGRVPWRSFRGRLWVNLEVSVPRNYHLDIATQAGNIEVPEAGGRVTLVSAGGNITVGQVRGAATLETQGGHIRVANVEGNLRATTAGGHVHVERVEGDAVLRSSGGHLRAGVIQGSAQLETGGGNIVLDRAGGRVNASSAGGRIEFGQAAGAIQARTAGGGIRVAQVSGPTELETVAGSIHLMKVEGPVRASTSAGSITAWFLSEGNLTGGSQLICNQGDIVVFLPRNLAVTIDATIEMAADHRVVVDPGIPLKVAYATAAQGASPAAAGRRILRAEGALNGGGHLLRLKTVAGNIHLQYADTASVPQVHSRQHRVLADRMRVEQEKQMQQLEEQQQRELSRLEALQERLRRMFLGPRRVPSDVQDRRITRRVQPAYPRLAREAGIEGTVLLDVYVSHDGEVEDVKVLTGHQLLARAAEEAVRQWRYQPAVAAGRPVPVVTTVSVDFRLQR